MHGLLFAAAAVVQVAEGAGEGEVVEAGVGDPSDEGVGVGGGGGGAYAGIGRRPIPRRVGLRGGSCGIRCRGGGVCVLGRGRGWLGWRGWEFLSFWGFLRVLDLCLMGDLDGKGENF